MEYFAGADIKDPLVSPESYSEVLARFPPTILITGSRDSLASAVFQTHRELVRLGVTAELHVWDGMWHGFIQEVDLPEAKEAYEATAKFFNSHLGERSRGNSN
jgi:epsilon-lactone hydrolase